MLVCVKHFAGYGAAEGGRDYDSSYVPEELMQNVYFVPFHAAEQAGAGSFMSAYMDLNDVPATGNRWLLTDVLRKQWGFNGFVVSDAWAVGSLLTHGYAKDPEDAAYKAVTAGLDMDMASLTYPKYLAGLVHSGKVTEGQLDAAVLPILQVKYELGLFDHPYVDETKVDSTLSRPEGRELERKSRRAPWFYSRMRTTPSLSASPLRKSQSSAHLPTPCATSKVAGQWKASSAADQRVIRSPYSQV